MTQWVKEHRDQKLRVTMKTLRAKLQGTWNYYGLIGNSRRMQLLYEATCRGLYKWLNRRSQKRSLTWSALRRLLTRFQVPRPRMVEQRAMPCQRELSFCQRLVDVPLRGQFSATHARAS
jgi:RNA-directed DNA polymerase